MIMYRGISCAHMIVIIQRAHVDLCPLLSLVVAAIDVLV